MLVNFLQAADGTRLTKTFTPDGAQPYPDVAQFNSFSSDIEDLESFFELLKLHAELGHCLLKGRLKRDLSQERRAGSTNNIEPTEYLVLDLDFDSGFADVDQFMDTLGLGDVSYILHHSASSGIRYKTGLRSHVIILLAQPVTPGIIKNWLQHLNLTVPQLHDLTQLSANGFSLRWPLDCTTCQNDKLIYIADPTCLDGVADPMQGRRFELHLRSQDRYEFPFKGHEFLSVSALTIARINELRAAANLPRRHASYGTVNQVEILRNPARAVVTGVKEAREFVYLNLNGGDSWGYYYPQGKPDLLYNFKGEPIVRLRDIDPDYYQSVMEQTTPVDPNAPPAPDVSEAGELRWIFRTEDTDTYYTARMTPGENAIVHPTSRRGALDWMRALTGDEPEIIPDWRLEFDPCRLDACDIDRRWLNLFRPTDYIKASHPLTHSCPPIIGRILRSICVDDVTYQHFINWLAHIFQTRQPARTAWIFRGTSGTGKGTLFTHILSPLFGNEHCRETTMEKFAEKFNDYIRATLFLMIDEGEIDDRQSSLLMAKAKHIITEPMVECRAMRQSAVPVPNFVNLIVATNNRTPIKLEAEDRRWNVAPCQETSLSDAGFDVNLIREIPGELDQFAAFLAHYQVNEDAVRSPLKTAPRLELTLASETSIEEIFRSLREGHLDFFAEHLFSEDGSEPSIFRAAYRAVVFRWCREYRDGPIKVANSELKAVYEYLTNGRITALKLGKIAAHRWCRARTLRDGSVVYKGWPVTFTSEEPAWIQRALDEESQTKPHLKVVK